jgi:hypothetical protein
MHPAHQLGDEVKGQLPQPLGVGSVECPRGDEATFVPWAGASHLDMIDPAGAAFHQVAAVLNRFSPPPA